MTREYLEQIWDEKGDNLSKVAFEAKREQKGRNLVLQRSLCFFDEVKYIAIALGEEGLYVQIEIYGRHKTGKIKKLDNKCLSSSTILLMVLCRHKQDLL
jgi:hypothetical protein